MVIIIIIVVVLGGIWYFVRKPFNDKPVLPTVVPVKTDSKAPLSGLEIIKTSGTEDQALDSDTSMVDQELNNLSADTNAALK